MTSIELDLKAKGDWIEMFPFGLAVGAPGQRPVMIFKDKTEKRVLPVWLSPLDAGIAVSQSGTKNQSSPHELAVHMMDALGIKAEKCLFREVRGGFQYVDIHFSGSRKLKTLESRADAAISFCLRSGCKFFATVDYIERSRVLEDVIGMGMQVPPEKNPHPYLN